MGHEVKVSLSGSFLKGNVINFKPDIIYLPWMTEKILRFFESVNCKAILLNSYQEQNQLLDKKQNPHILQLQLSNHFFAWGDIYEERAKVINPNINVHTVGVTRYDAYLDEDLKNTFFKSKKQLSKDFGIPYNTKWILFAYDYAILFKPDRIKKALDRGLKTQEYIDKSWIAFHRLSEWLKVLSKENPNVSFILRPHPGAPLEKIKEIQGLSNEEYENVFYNTSGSIGQWIVNCDRYVTRLSSSILEAWIADVPTVSIFTDLRTKDIEGYMHLKACKNHISTLDELSKFINSPSTNSSFNEHRDFLEQKFGKLDGKSCFRTAEIIDKIAQENIHKFAYSKNSISVDLKGINFLVENNIKAFLNNNNLLQYTKWAESHTEYVSEYYIKSKEELLRQFL
ncbi:MAG: hypothetical protein AB8G11_02870 [Saprospiraceae bacterium]